ncbi:MAG: hypothetical protein P8Y74_15280, partial [Desulfobacterales bacterium]
QRALALFLLFALAFIFFSLVAHYGPFSLVGFSKGNQYFYRRSIRSYIHLLLQSSCQLFKACCRCFNVLIYQG